MIKREKVQALVLARRDVGEADRLVTLFTREHGLLRAEARGVRRIPSRRGGHLEPFTKILCIISGSAGRYFLAGSESSNLFPNLHRDAKALSHAEHLAGLVVRLLSREEAQVELFDALTDVFAAMPSLETAKQDLMEIGCSLYILSLAGMSPNFEQCGRCGISKPESAAIISGAQGGWHCLTCNSSFKDSGNSISARGLIALRWLAQNPRSSLRLKTTAHEAQQLLSATRKLSQELTQQVHA